MRAPTSTKMLSVIVGRAFARCSRWPETRPPPRDLFNVTDGGYRPDKAFSSAPSRRRRYGKVSPPR